MGNMHTSSFASDVYRYNTSLIHSKMSDTASQLYQPEHLVAAEPVAVGECTSETWVGLAQLNIAQQLCSAYCTAGWM